MKIIVPVEKGSENSDIGESLGRAPYYLLFDTENRVAEYLENPVADSPSGAGVGAAQTITDSGADVLLTLRCGDRAYEVLREAGIKVFLALSGKAEFSIEAYLEGNLSELASVHKGHHHGAD
ncbi:MAG: hypothetical protein PWR17_264 [Candidatus Methanomethylophilaceae archaeon]|nr:hypothetical protein [Candidatus Methanomethylophilaceae archaeon]